MATTDKPQTLQQILSKANPNDICDALRAVDLGLKHAVIKVAFAGLTSAASFDITTAASKAAATITGITLDTGVNLPAIGKIITLRVVTGTATGHRNVTDVGGTASTTLATISDDGKTITFEAVITAFTLTYEPRSATALTGAFGSLP